MCYDSVKIGANPFVYAGYSFIEMVAVPRQKLHHMLGAKYAEEIKHLASCGVILPDNSYMSANQEGGRSICKSYGITAKGKFLLGDAQKTYLYQLTTNPKAIRDNARNLKDRGYSAKTFPNPVLQNTKDNIDAIENLEELVALVPNAIKAKNGKSDAEAQRVARHCLIQLITKKYKELAIHDQTGRMYPPLATLNKNLKKSAVINGQKFVCAIDIRSCIPTFFGLYCLKLRKERQKARELDIDDTTLASEVETYTAIFCSESEHPRAYLARALRYDIGHSASDSEIKKMLNEGLNGSGREECKQFRAWIKQQFPNMHKVWATTDIRTTGSNLSKYYESPIFRNPKVIKMAKKHFLEYVDNHDEALLYGDSYNAKKFVKWFKPFARKTVGIDVQFSVE